MGVKWTYLNIEEIRKELAKRSLPVCREVAYRLLANLKLGRRKIFKNVVMKEVENRDEQFHRIKNLKRHYLSRGYAVLSIDTKKKEYLGRFYRPGRVYCSIAPVCYDHDFNSFATGKIVPYGIFDLGLNEGHLFIGNSRDTAEFAVQCLRNWWYDTGCKSYKTTNPILIICDGGGSNASRSHLFKEQLQILSSEIGVTIRVAHYPSYCSKYNPIEHRLFPAITRAWSGVMLDSIDTAIQLLLKRTSDLKSGLRVFAKAIQETFEKGNKIEPDFWKTCNIKFDKLIPKWNYRIFPTP